MLNADKEPGNWLHHHKNYCGPPLLQPKEINRDTVKNLKVAWTMHLGGIEGGGIWSHGGLEGTPIAENGFLYVTDGWGSVYKIDTHGGRGELLWKMDPKTDHDWAGAVACCGVDNRGVALWDDLVISHTLDGRLIATDKETGQVAWQRQVADPDKGEVDHRRSAGRQGHGDHRRGRRGVRHPRLARRDRSGDPEGDLAHLHDPGQRRAWHETWKDANNAAATGGGSTWVTGSYDPATDTIIWGTGNPGPDWDSEYRPGDNLYTDSSLGLDANTGKIKWHYQHTPNDPYDYDSVAENVLVDVPGRPEARARSRPQRFRLCHRPDQGPVRLGPAVRQEGDVDQRARPQDRQAAGV